MCMHILCGEGLKLPKPRLIRTQTRRVMLGGCVSPAIPMNRGDWACPDVAKISPRVFFVLWFNKTSEVVMFFTLITRKEK